MRRALLLILLVLSPPAVADMYQDARNAELPAAMINLAREGINLTPVTATPALTQSPGSMDLTGGGWGINNWFGAKPPLHAQWLFGSKDNPVTAGGSAVAIGVVQAIPKENCFNNTAATGCNSALLLQNIGTGGSTMVSSALTAYAETQSTVGGGLGNAQGINALGVVSATSNANGMGAFINGVRLGTLGGITSMELRATNNSSADCNAAAHDLTSQCMGLHLALVGPPGGPKRLVSSAIQVSGITSLYGGAREGLIFGFNSITEKTIADRTSSATSIYIDGNHDVAFQTTRALSGKVLLGTPASYAGPGAFERSVQIYSPAGVQFGDFGSDINSPNLTFTKSRNATVGSHTAVAANDHLGQIIMSGSDGASYSIGAMILSTVEGTVSAGVVPTKLAFWTTNSSGVGTEVMKVTSAGTVVVSGGITASGLPTSAGSGGLYMCVDSVGAMYKKATCP